MHALWCCSSRSGRPFKKSDFRFTLRSSRAAPVVDTSNPQNDASRLKSEQISPFEGPVELCQFRGAHVEVSDVESSVSTPETGVFNGTKAKIINRLPLQKTSRRNSKVSIGHSDEELTRRAEVRRLRQKRIQDELDKDDDHGSSDRNSNHNVGRPAGWFDISCPCNGPRDTIEFTVEDCDVASFAASSNASSHAYTSSREECCPSEASFILARTAPSKTRSEARRKQPVVGQVKGPLRERRCVSLISLSQRPSSCEPSSSRLDRILGSDNDFNIRHGSHAWDDQSSLGVWLIAQSFKSTGNSIRQEPTDVVDDLPFSQRLLVRDRLSGVDSIIESSFSKPDRAQVPGPGLLAYAENRQEGIREGAPTELNHPLPPSPEVEVGKNAHSTHKAEENKGSSNYPSTLPSFDSSLAGSGTNGYVLTQQDLDNLELSPVVCGFFVSHI
ncbi:uncharacterized protein UV8b_00742 [Ustilaginoidea virens]|uniref:Uncharacterized protein n=1 Tax=Ustilaginoidea virens TaxID=1159556 RepID=A0A8E5MDN9_USTVR|nr:uncharacterized protein UV8b_00742 [Ustilaginoidea virens]QUC16501.1 hypothetical protein UV8b_00742 [Ustilaginoidea virens]